MPRVTAKKSFQGSAEEGFVHVGREIEVSEARHRALARNGLVAHPEGEEPAPSAPASGLVRDPKPRRTRLVGGEG